MASINMSIRTDSELSSEQSLCADLLRARSDRTQGKQGRLAEGLLKEMDSIIEESDGRAYT